MFEILMLLGFSYTGFCYLLPEKKQPVKPAAPKQNDNRFPTQATLPKPRQAGPHLVTSDKRHPGAQDTLRSGRRVVQRRLCKTGRLC